MSRTRTTTEYAIFGKMDDGLWYKVNRNEIISHTEAQQKISAFADNLNGSPFTEYRIMERTVTITTGEWNETE